MVGPGGCRSTRTQFGGRIDSGDAFDPGRIVERKIEPAADAQFQDAARRAWNHLGAQAHDRRSGAAFGQEPRQNTAHRIGHASTG